MTKTEELTALFDAVGARDLAEVERLLATMDANARHPWREGSLLHHAVCDPVDQGLVKLLLTRGADHDARHPETGGTPLHQLLSASLELRLKLEMIDLLIAHGADLNVVVEDMEHSQYTAVGIAMAGGSPAAGLLQALRERGGVPCSDECWIEGARWRERHVAQTVCDSRPQLERTVTLPVSTSEVQGLGLELNANPLELPPKVDPRRSVAEPEARTKTPLTQPARR